MYNIKDVTEHEDHIQNSIVALIVHILAFSVLISHDALMTAQILARPNILGNAVWNFKPSPPPPQITSTQLSHC